MFLACVVHCCCMRLHTTLISRGISIASPSSFFPDRCLLCDLTRVFGLWFSSAWCHTFRIWMVCCMCTSINVLLTLLRARGRSRGGTRSEVVGVMVSITIIWLCLIIIFSFCCLHATTCYCCLNYFAVYLLTLRRPFPPTDAVT